MPHVADLFAGKDEVSFPFLSGDEVVRVFERGTVRLTGELAAYDGTPIPLGLHSDGEEWDVVFAAMENDGSTGIGVCRQGVRPVAAVSGGRMMVNSGTVCVTTVEQVMAAGELDPAPRSSPWILPGSVSESVRIHNGFGDGPVDLIALFDGDHQMCGVFVGDVFESSSWEERLLPGEKLVSTKELKNGIDDIVGGDDEHTPVAVYNEEGELLGYVAGYDLVYTFSLFLATQDRPAEPPTPS